MRPVPDRQRSAQALAPGTTRRAFVRGGASSLLLVAASPLTSAAGAFAAGAKADLVPSAAAVTLGRAAGFGALGPPDANGLRLPAGFRSRVVARSGERVPGTRHVWHADPDGGATFATSDGGWIYVSNAEANRPGAGGVGALRFDAQAKVVAAYSILSGTTRNCAGGRTPWQTWLSCEEIPRGQVFECDPFAPGSQGIARPALGRFQHEAVAVDPVGRRLFLTEDESDGLLYRFTPARWPDLGAGRLEAAQILDPARLGPIRPGETRSLSWHPIEDPGAHLSPTRRQAGAATRFAGGEGIDYHAGRIVFATKGDDRLWALDPARDRIQILFDPGMRPDSPLSGVDNVLLAPNGDVYVAEDPGDLQIVALTSSGALEPIVQVVGQSGSELTGPALSPDGRRLYFSSQRSPGTTYEIEGPFAPADGSSEPA